MLSRVWELYFNGDSTAHDFDKDTVGDWIVDGGDPFNPNSLVNGIWHADATLLTYPPDDFIEPVVIDLRMRNTSQGGDGAVFKLNYDFSVGLQAFVKVKLQLQPDATQTLTVLTKTGVSTIVPMVSVPGLSANFADIRLLIDPSQDSLNVKVNGEDRGTYAYTPFVGLTNERYAIVTADGSSAEYDWIRIRVGGTSP